MRSKTPVSLNNPKCAWPSAVILVVGSRVDAKEKYAFQITPSLLRASLIH